MYRVCDTLMTKKGNEKNRSETKRDCIVIEERCSKVPESDHSIALINSIHEYGSLTRLIVVPRGHIPSYFFADIIRSQGTY